MSFFMLVLFLQLSHNGWLLPPCSAKIAPFDIAADTYSLIAFRDHYLLTTNVSNILRTNWTSASNATTSSVVCHWIGVTCGARHQIVVALDLGDMGLTGTIPSHFGNLSFLRVLDISNNKFHGQLPKEMARLRRLSFLNVGFNSLSGNIPSWFGLLPQLKYLGIQNNSFTVVVALRQLRGFRNYVNKDDVMRFLELMHIQKLDAPFIAMYQKEECPSLFLVPRDLEGDEQNQKKPTITWHKVLWAIQNLNRKWLLLHKRKITLQSVGVCPRGNLII